MSRELHCRDLGFDCGGVVVADNDEDVLVQVADHARQVHGMEDAEINDPAFASQVRDAIHDQT